MPWNTFLKSSFHHHFLDNFPYSSTRQSRPPPPASLQRPTTWTLFAFAVLPSTLCFFCFVWFFVFVVEPPRYHRHNCLLLQHLCLFLLLHLLSPQFLVPVVGATFRNTPWKSKTVRLGKIRKSVQNLSKSPLQIRTELSRQICWYHPRFLRTLIRLNFSHRPRILSRASRHTRPRQNVWDDQTIPTRLSPMLISEPA